MHWISQIYLYPAGYQVIQEDGYPLIQPNIMENAKTEMCS